MRTSVRECLQHLQTKVCAGDKIMLDRRKKSSMERKKETDMVLAKKLPNDEREMARRARGMSN